MNNETITLIVDGANGIYVPQRFVRNFDTSQWGVSNEDADILKAGPDHEHYWDVWESVIRQARLTDGDGRSWSLYQDGDLFAVREDHEFSE